MPRRYGGRYVRTIGELVLWHKNVASETNCDFCGFVSWWTCRKCGIRQCPCTFYTKNVRPNCACHPNIFTFARSLNILRYSEGLAGLAFSN